MPKAGLDVCGRKMEVEVAIAMLGVEAEEEMEELQGWQQEQEE